MWDNEDWAARHIRKHGVRCREAWEVVFEGEDAWPLLAPDQLRFPPFRRYWAIGRTKKGRRLMVVWERYRKIQNLITAFEPSKEKVEIYEKKTKGKRKKS